MFVSRDQAAYDALRDELAEHQAAEHPDWTGTLDEPPGNAFSWRGRLF
jgi:hypothetical protein